MIAADFLLNNQARPLDCFAFTIFPYDAMPAEIEEDVSRALSRDIKKTKDLDENPAQWLRDPRRFHIAITINKDRKVFSNGPGTDQRQVAREHISLTLDALDQKNTNADMLAHLKELQKKAQSQGFNVALLRNIWLLAIWFAVLTNAIGRERASEIIGWFPDRDEMTTWCDGIWRDYTYWDVADFAEEFQIDLTSTHIGAGAPDRSTGKEVMWFDYMMRSADWLAGAVSAWDRATNAVPGEHPKYLKMVEDVLADADNILLMHLDLKQSGGQFRRINTTKTPPTTS